MHLVAAGHLAVQVSTPDGERVTLNVLSPGDSGRRAVTGAPRRPDRRSATVVALDAAETRVLGMGVFQGALPESPGGAGPGGGRRCCRPRARPERTAAGADVRRPRPSALPPPARPRRGVRRRATGPAVVPLTQEQLADLVGGTRPDGQPGAATAAGPAGDRARPRPASPFSTWPPWRRKAGLDVSDGGPGLLDQPAAPRLPATSWPRSPPRPSAPGPTTSRWRCGCCEETGSAGWVAASTVVPVRAGAAVQRLRRGGRGALRAGAAPGHARPAALRG